MFLAISTKYSSSGRRYFLDRLLEAFVRKGDGLTSPAILFLDFLLDALALLFATAPFPF